MSLDKQLTMLLERHRQNIVNFCCQCIAIPSLVGSEENMQQFIAQKLEQLGLQVDMWMPDLAELSLHPAYDHVDTMGKSRPIVVATWGEGNKGNSLILNGHVDVVDPGNLEHWNTPPFRPVVKNGRIYGRGSCDMKGGLTAIVFAIQLLQKAGFRPRGTVIVESVVGEENGGFGTLAAIKRGYRADAAVVVEPTSLNIIPAQTGSLTFRLTVAGKAAHACVRDQGVSAVEKFWPVFIELQRLEKERNSQFQHDLFSHIDNKVPISIGRVKAGSWPSTVPDQVIAEGRFGVLVGESISEAKALFEQRIATACHRDEWLRSHPVKVEWFEGTFEAAATPIEHPLVSAVQNAASYHEHPPVQLKGVTYGSDMRLLINQARVPTVMYGPGHIELAHAANEHIEIKHILLATRTLARLIADWCG